ncbi:MAG: O-antigen ligase [Devosia sp.]
MTTLAAHREGGGAGALGRALLFFVIIAYYWVSLAPFQDLSLASSADPWAGNSNLVNQAVAMALFAVLVGFVLNHPLRQEIAQPRLLLIGLLGWFVVTSLLADDPSTALRRVVMAAMIVVSASIVLLLPRNSEHFAKLFGTALAALLALAYFGVIFLPNLSIHQASDVVEPLLAGDWRGYISHKNVAAPAMAFTMFGGMFVWARWSKLPGAVLVVGAFIFLYNTGGKTSLGMVPLILVASWAFERWRSMRMPIALGGVALVNLVTVGSSIWEPMAKFVSGLGIDATFTERVDIWSLAFSAIAERPLTGYGISGFWQTESLVYGGGVLETWAVNAANAHNAYLETAMAAGIPGLILVVFWLIIGPVRDANRAIEAGNDSALTRLFTRIWLYGLYASCVESFFFANSGPIWITILIGVFGLRYQHRSQLVSVASPAPHGVVYA